MVPTNLETQHLPFSELTRRPLLEAAMVTQTGGPTAGVSPDGIYPRTQLPTDQGIGNNPTFVNPTLNSSAFKDISRQIDEILAVRKKVTAYFLSLDNKLSALQATRATQPWFL